MSRNSKLTDEERIMAVQEYLNGEGSYNSISRKYGIANERFRQLVIRAQAEGIDSVKIRLSSDGTLRYHCVLHSVV